MFNVTKNYVLVGYKLPLFFLKLDENKKDIIITITFMSFTVMK